MAFLPLLGGVLALSGAASQLVARIGARPLLVTGAAACAGGLYWLSLITGHDTYAGGLLGPILVIGAGLGCLFVPLTLVSLAGVPDAESGMASSLLNTGQQVGGAIGLAVLGTVAWTVVADNARAHAAAAASAAYSRALAVGFGRAFLVAAGIAVLLLVTAVTMIRIRRTDLTGSKPEPDFKFDFELD